MKEQVKKHIDSLQESHAFIKTSDLPVSGLTDPQKVALNRKANALFNEGKFGMAERIFITTGYSDGLTRVGDTYAQKKDYFSALKLYLLAHNRRKSEPIIEKISQAVSVLLKT